MSRCFATNHRFCSKTGLTGHRNAVMMARISAKSLIGFVIPFIQKAYKRLPLSAFFCARITVSCMEALQSAAGLLSGNDNSVQSTTLGLSSKRGGFNNRYQKEAPMPNHTRVASATYKTPIYPSLADYANDGLYLLQELDEISSILQRLIEHCHDCYDKELSHALSLIHQSQHRVYHELTEGLQILAQKTADGENPGADDAS